MKLRLGSLFSGWGGLDQAIHAAIAAFGADVETVWVSDIEQYDSKGHRIGNAPAILAHRYPDVPNLGDITTVDWSAVEPVDIITGGSPCQDLSHAGRRAGMSDGTRSNLWVAMREAIATMKPAYVIWENVHGSLSASADSALEHCPGCMGDPRDRGPVLRALGRVLGDLADLGFDAEWAGLGASDVGAPHRRFRVFVVAAHPERCAGIEWGQPATGEASGGWSLGAASRRDRVALDLLPSAVMSLLPTPSVADATGGHERRGGKRGDELLLKGIATHDAWGPYADAIARWEAIHGPAPAPTKAGRNGRPKLNPQFSEWMMGAPPGWITDTPGLTDNQASHAIGNGVVPHQGAAAIRLCLERLARTGAA